MNQKPDEENNLKAERVQFWQGLAEAGRATADTVREFLDGVIAALRGLRNVFSLTRKS